MSGPRHGSIRGSLVATLVVSGTLLCEDASAYCRGMTMSGPDPAATGQCFAGGGAFELYWKNRCVGYSVQKDASRQITLAQATLAATQAFARWSGAVCDDGQPSIQAIDEGPVECGQVGYRSDQANQHVIVFRDDGWPHDDMFNMLALTTITYDTTDGEIFDADIEVNSHDFNLVVGSVPPAADGGMAQTYDLESVLTHEAGHFLGLAHSTDQSATMWTFYQPGSSALTADDAAGICSIDAPNGSRSTSAGVLMADACDPTPRHGFSSQCASALADAGTGQPDAGNGSSLQPTSRAVCSVAHIGAPSRAPLGVLLPLAGLLIRFVRRSVKRGRWDPAEARRDVNQA